MKLTPSDYFSNDTDRVTKPATVQGMTHAEAMAGIEASTRKSLRDRASRILRGMKAQNPGRRFEKDAEARIYEKLLEEFEANKAASEAAKQESLKRIAEMDANSRRQREEAKARLAKALAAADPEALAEELLLARDRLISLVRAGVLTGGDLPPILAEIA